ncbi:hypothetical protein K505DRAFT_30851 [Melanomma pulvis-pyrius CBS 109.77]|uniref:Uncharacterized protein n=1 Tax=Melanomma pulvis-pyrius CBS 109.77 TaxID=1314802 RepID=A0A6A6XEK0_9PLEO|nr:hypothetical protein K505DRAFT_30851 [Melanomma pulvis-pyrius CBS 109.77]
MKHLRVVKLFYLTAYMSFLTVRAVSRVSGPTLGEEVNTIPFTAFAASTAVLLLAELCQNALIIASFTHPLPLS